MKYKDLLNAEKSERLTSFEWQKKRSKVLLEFPMCVQCGSKDSLEVDHIVPKALGGSDDDKNLQVLCNKCHKKKSSKDADRISRANKIKRIESEKRRGALTFD